MTPFMRLFSGSFRHKKLTLPKNAPIRPTTSKVRMQVFNICQGCIEGARVLDLFAGSGSIGFEAISRGAAHCTFVEQNKHAVSMLHHNIQELDLEKSCSVLAMDALLAIKKLSHSPPFSLVYIDPPYDLVETPFFTELLAAIDSSLPMDQEATLFIETRKKSSLPTFRSFTLISHRTSGQSELWQYEKRV